MLYYLLELISLNFSSCCFTVTDCTAKPVQTGEMREACIAERRESIEAFLQ